MSGVPGRTYNVGSGVGTPVLQVVEYLLSLAKRPVRICIDPLLTRPSDTPVLVADVTLIKRDTGWAPSFGLDDAVTETLEWWRERMKAHEAT